MDEIEGLDDVTIDSNGNAVIGDDGVPAEYAFSADGFQAMEQSEQEDVAQLRDELAMLKQEIAQQGQSGSGPARQAKPHIKPVVRAAPKPLQANSLASAWAAYESRGHNAVIGDDGVDYADDDTAAMDFESADDSDDDMDMPAAQEAVRNIMIARRDATLPTPPQAVAGPRVAPPQGKVCQVVHVDTEASALQRRQAAPAARSSAILSIEDLFLGEDDGDGGGDDGSADDESETDATETIPLSFGHPLIQDNVHAWRSGDTVTAAMRVLTPDGQSRVLTATTSHDAEVQKIAAIAQRLGYTPEQVLRLPIDELCSRLAAGKLIPPMAKAAKTILGYESQGAAPYSVAIYPAG